MKTMPEIIGDLHAAAKRIRERGTPNQKIADYDAQRTDEAADAIEAAFVKNNDDYNCLLTEARLEVRRLKMALEPVMACFTAFFVDDAVGTPIEQADIYGGEDGELTIENRYGGTNTGAPIKKTVLDCVNAVVKAKYIMEKNDNGNN